ncbi:MAG: hypothetical protein KAJ49_09740 [Arcobacteraceae bacterium]|nr:hypothetical protein [Arcobacteraceae bacterium]
MEEKVLACDNEICKEKDNCERYRLYKAGEKEYKTHNGKKHKGCGQFIQNTK